MTFCTCNRADEMLDKIEAMREALQLALRSRWLSIDYDHNRTKEACDIRAAMRAAIAKAESTDAA